MDLTGGCTPAQSKPPHRHCFFSQDPVQKALPGLCGNAWESQAFSMNFFFGFQGRFFLHRGGDAHIHRLAQFRTCLWLRAGRRISGQEAGKTPVVGEQGASRPSLKNRPVAGGEPAAPPEAGDAAQSNDGAGFFGLSRVPSPATEEACPSCRACGGVFPYQAMASLNGRVRLWRICS